MGNHIHTSAYVALFGGDAGIVLADFIALSSRVTVYAVSEDYSGMSLTNSMIPSQYKELHQAEVTIGKHVIVGSTKVILPGVEIGEGVAIGSMSLVRQSLESWGDLWWNSGWNHLPDSKRYLNMEGV